MQTPQNGTGIFITGASLVLLACLAITHANLQARVNMVYSQGTYEQALQVAKTYTTASKNSEFPTSSNEWITLFKQASDGRLHTAPGGGPAFVLNKQGSAHTGAIGVTVTNFGQELILTRPAYASLETHTTRITLPARRHQVAQY